MKKMLYHVVQCLRKRGLYCCGSDVRIGKGCDIRGNIKVGDHVVIGDNCRLISTRAVIDIQDHVVFGPDVTIYSGDHRFDIVGKYLIDIKDSMKLPENDKDVIVESDVWIGTRVIILKGVTIGRGSIIGAGTIVTKSIPPYSIVTGSASLVIRPRFSDDTIKEHENKLYKG